MLTFIAISSVIAVVAGFVSARLFARRVKAEALKGGFVYAASAIATILMLQLVPLIFGRLENASESQFIAVDSFAFVACLFLFCFGYFGLKKHEKKAS